MVQQALKRYMCSIVLLSLSVCNKMNESLSFDKKNHDGICNTAVMLTTRNELANFTCKSSCWIWDIYNDPIFRTIPFGKSYSGIKSDLKNPEGSYIFLILSFIFNNEVLDFHNEAKNRKILLPGHIYSLTPSPPHNHPIPGHIRLH